MVSAVFVTGVALASAEDYRVSVAGSGWAEVAHRKDSPVVLDGDLRDTWTSRTGLDLTLIHRVEVGAARARLAHALFVTGVPDERPAVGSNGNGDADLAVADLTHELYEASLQWAPTGWFSTTIGRQFPERLAPVTLESVDALSPGTTEAARPVGFDGATVTITGPARLYGRGILAVQDAVRTDTVENVRLAAFIGLRSDAAHLRAGMTYQDRTIFRPTAAAGVDLPSMSVGLESAVEVYDPRNEIVDPVLILATGARLKPVAGLIRVAGVEYLYNGLSRTYPDPLVGDIDPTTDAAGAFRRPGEHYAVGTATVGSPVSWATTHRVAVNLTDGSAFGAHSVTVAVTPVTDLRVGAEWTSGAVDSEFGAIEEDLVIRASVVISPGRDANRP